MGSYEGEEERSLSSSGDEMMQAAPRMIGYEFSDQSPQQPPQRAKTAGQQKDMSTQQMSYEEIIMARFQQKEQDKDQEDELADSRIRVSELAQGPTTADNETDKHFFYEKDNVVQSNSGAAVESM